MAIMYTESYLAHHGIKGQKWGIRRYQNEDGTLTSEGQKRYGAKSSDSKITQQVKKDFGIMDDSQFKKKYAVSKNTYAKRVDKYGDPYTNSPYAKLNKKLKTPDTKKAVKSAAVVAGGIIAAYGAYKLGDKMINNLFPSSPKNPTLGDTLAIINPKWKNGKIPEFHKTKIKSSMKDFDIEGLKNIDPTGLKDMFNIPKY